MYAVVVVEEKEDEAEKYNFIYSSPVERFWSTVGQGAFNLWL